MRFSDWARRLGEIPSIGEAFQDLEGGCIWQSLAIEGRAPLCAAAYHQHPRKTLVVTANYERALQWQARLGLCGIPPSDIRLLPSGLSVLFEDAAPETVALSDRIGALKFLTEDRPGFVIATPQAALERTLPADVLQGDFVDIRQGETIDMDDALRALQRLGYEAAEPVRVPGQYSRRGGILDVFPMGCDRPFRAEFFGDEVESLREFDPMSQKSIRPITHLSIAPSRETLLPLETDGIRDLLEPTLRLEAANLSEENANRLTELTEADIDALERHVFFDRLDLYRPVLQPDSGCAVDLLGEDGLVVLDEPLEVEALVNRNLEELAAALEHRAERGEVLASTANDFMLGPEHFAYSPRCLGMMGMDAAPYWFPKGPVHELNANSLEVYRGQPQALTQALKNWLNAGLCVILGTDQPTRAKAVLAQVELFPVEDAARNGQTGPFAPGLHLAEGNLAGGFAATDAQLVVLTDQELFGVGRLKLPQRKFNEGVPIATVLDLKPGDYVVHINFGVGIYRGLVKQVSNGIEKEFLFIEYQAPDKLFVPADQLDRVQKYLSPGDGVPKVNRLSGGDWQKAVGKAREEAREFARELIKLYARRKAVERPSFGPDTPWQAEMEVTFPWVETPSQMEAVRDAKRDLQTDYPMDRLVCGDVGFGKTEVAIRAAFKVAVAGKQVAVLCPTTILSEQHFRSFSERLGAFPIRIDYLNRFRTTAERRGVLEDVKSGDVDIIVGTHALLSKDMKFKDLGLLVIDEEQKFGVKHKEALKALRVNVDVLSMSATPIPRTLSMALMNIRQMSVINDPPPGRLPIRTFVRPYADSVIREAVLRELSRGGQIYYVYNRVEGIRHVAEKLRKLAPTARIAVGHGQMSEKELEPVMLGFIRGEIDILLSTTIIENGLDIPNANTLIVENADRFGLSQLYQLRGRVGRSDRQAYAYLLYQGSRAMTEMAMARLQALSEFSMLGSGYSLAFRDLQIRGAGDLLGAKQSGQMAAVGYDLYTQLIESELGFLKEFADGSTDLELADPLEGLAVLPTVDLPVVALIPEAYIEEQGQRLYYYKRIMSARTVSELGDASREIADRYGRLPKQVDAALTIMEFRLKANELGIEKVDGSNGRLTVLFRPSAAISPRVFSIVFRRRKDARLAQDRLVWPFTGSALAACRAMLTELETAIDEVEAQRAVYRS